ncbi:serine protease 57-like [Cyanocitta cristata]
MVCKPVSEERIDESEDRVVLGAHQVSIAEKEQQIFEIMEIFHHHQFDWSSRKNDIILLKLNDTAKLNQYVQCLPLQTLSKVLNLAYSAR